jgi:TP53 regulating kinase-like protein
MIDAAKYLIYMEYIDGQTANAFIQSCSDAALRCRVAREIGAALGHMHNAGVVHGDLTTSNIMLKSVPEAPTGMRVVIIDFGLASTLPSIEDRAVDLYVLERAFVSSHPGCDALIHEVLDAYRFAHKDGAAVLLRLEQVRLRGRKRDMVG